MLNDIRKVTAAINLGVAIIKLTDEVYSKCKKSNLKQTKTEDGKVIFECGCVRSHVEDDGTVVYMANPIIV